MKKTTLISIILIIIAIVISVYAYPQLPAKIASHWDINGKVNGYMDKLLGIALIPAIMIILSIFLLFIPRIDPLRKNIESFRTYYNWFIVIFLAYLLAIQTVIILWAFGIQVNILVAISVGIAILFFYLSILLKKSRRNWFIGIRTPWTLSNDKVWKKTHYLGSILFKIIAVLALLGILFPNQFIWLFIIPVLASVAILLVYSYLVYKRLKK